MVTFSYVQISTIIAVIAFLFAVYNFAIDEIISDTDAVGYLSLVVMCCALTATVVLFLT